MLKLPRNTTLINYTDNLNIHYQQIFMLVKSINKFFWALILLW